MAPDVCDSVQAEDGGRKSCSSSGWGADRDPSSTFSAALSHQQYGNHFWEGIMWILALTAFLFGGRGRLRGCHLTAVSSNQLGWWLQE